jgi:hypothetical protein
MVWQEELEDMLGSYFSDWSIEEGVSQLVFVTEDNRNEHLKITNLIKTGITASLQNNSITLDIVNRYCYVRDRVAAREFLIAILDEYNKQYALSQTR